MDEKCKKSLRLADDLKNAALPLLEGVCETCDSKCPPKDYKYCPYGKLEQEALKKAILAYSASRQPEVGEL